MWTSLVITLHYSLALLISLRVLMRPRLEPSVRLAWILVIEVVPVIGILSYLLFGEVRLRRAERRRMADVRARLTGIWQPSPESVLAPPEYAEQVVAAVQAVSGVRPVSGNRIGMLPEDDSAIDVLVGDIDHAAAHVHLLFYIWLDDASGRKVAEAAVRAARRGVTVRVIVDAVGSRGFTRSASWRAMCDAGCECLIALPVGLPILSMLFQRLDLRNHRKIVVIDNRIAYTGSRNCSDTAFEIKPRFAPWIDVFFRVQGPAVRQLQAVFLSDWMSYSGSDLGGMLEMVPGMADPGAVAQVIATGPDRRDGNLSDVLITLIMSAHERLVITTPYYVPDMPLDRAIRAAARRGVDVTLILPERNDSAVVASSSEGLWQGLLQAGVRLHLFAPGLLHAKIMTADGRMAMIGSGNLDRRSFELNYEVNMLILDHDEVAEIDARQDSYLARARELTLDEVNAWPRWRRLRNNLLALAAPLL